MKSVLSLLVIVAAMTMTGCGEPEPSSIVGPGDEDKVAEYNRLIAEEYAGYEEGEKAATEGGAGK